MQRAALSIDAMGACPFWAMLCLKRLPTLLQKAISKVHCSQVFQEPAPATILTITTKTTAATKKTRIDC